MQVIENIKQKIKGLSGDNKSVLTLVGGTTIAQGLSFLFSPITTRLFSPEVFGDLSVFTSITSIVSVIVCLRYELAIILPQDDDEGFALLKLSYIFAALVSTVTGMVFLLCGKTLYYKFGARDLAGYWYYVPICLFLTGIIQASNYWLTRTRQFKVLSLNKIVPVVVLNLVSIGLGLAGYRDIRVWLFSLIASYIANVAIFSKTILREFEPKKHISKYRFTELIKKYKNFLVYDVWGALINNLSWAIVPILMNSFFSANAAGQYSICMKVIHVPSSVIGASILQVFLKTASEKKYKGTLYPYCKETAKKLMKYTLPIVVLLFLFGKEVFHILFGSKWEVAGIYTQILMPWALVWFISSPLTVVFTICQKQNKFLIIAIFNLVTSLVSLYAGKLLNSDIWGMIFFSITGLILYTVSLFLAFREAKKSDEAYSEINKICR